MHGCVFIVYMSQCLCVSLQMPHKGNKCILHFRSRTSPRLMLSTGQGLLCCLSSTKRYVGEEGIGGGRRSKKGCSTAFFGHLFIYLLGVWFYDRVNSQN